MKCLNCGAWPPPDSSGPACHNCGATFTRRICPAPIDICGKKFTPCRNALCPVHGDSPIVEETEAKGPKPTSAELAEIHQIKKYAAGLLPGLEMME